MSCSSRVVRSASLAGGAPPPGAGNPFRALGPSGASGTAAGSFARATVHHSHTLGRSSGAEAKAAKASDDDGDGASAAGSSSSLTSLNFSAEDLASQLTLRDLPVFRAIQPEELSSCSWTKKNKLETAPNVVAFIRRFNHVSFWAVQEVLRHPAPKRRAEALAHLVRLAKKLHELNNLHSEFAVLSALQSAALYRLSRTWALLHRRERQTFERLAELFSERDNFARLREHMGATALKPGNDCVPYLGLYLTDLIYVDMAHPHSGGLESQQRQFKMNNILRIVSELQRSTYENLAVLPECQQYLESIRYIDELQKFIEEDNYKLSLKLEPNAPPATVAASSSSSKESVVSGTAAKNFSARDPGLMAELNLSPAKGNPSGGSSRGEGSRRGESGGGGGAKSKFVPGHRKCRSDGANIFLSCGGGFGGSSSKGGNGAGYGDDLSSWASGTLSSGSPSEECFRQHNLIDDSLVEDPSCCPPSSLAASEDSGSARSGLSLSGGGGSLGAAAAAAAASLDHLRLHGGGKSRTADDGRRQLLLSPLSDSVRFPDSPSLSSPSSSAALSGAGGTGGTLCTFQGCVKRKTLIKDGRRPAMSGWQRYWAQLWGSQLVYFLPRTLVTKGLERRDFRAEPCKCHSLDGWAVMVPDSGLGATDELSFQLADPSHRTVVYRFRAPSPELAAVWVRCLHEAANAAAAAAAAERERRQPPANLISFE